MRAGIQTLAIGLIALGALAQQPAGQMRLSVVDSETSQPLAGVKVRSWAGAGLVTDDSGSCSFSLPQRGSARFFYRIALTKAGYVPRYVTWSQSQNDTIRDIPTQYTARMEKGVTIGGTVKNEKGEPIAGARVIFSGAPGADGLRERNAVAPNYFSERTDDEGHWQCTETPKDFGNLTFRVTHPDYVPAFFACEGAQEADTNAVLLPMSNFLAGTAAMVLTHGIEVSGVVLDPAGKPASGVVITRNHEWHNPAAILTTGDDGRFAISNLRPGDLILTFQAQGMAGQTRELTLTNGVPELKIEMKPGNLFQGTVRDEVGKPIPGAQVEMDRLDLGPLEYDWSTVTDDQGRFQWDSAPDGRHPYFVSASGFHSRSEPDLIADGRDKSIALRREKAGDKTIIDGQITDAGSKAPVKAFSVLFKEFTGDGVAHSRRAVSAIDGHYSTEVDPASAGCMIEITAPGYAPQMSGKRSARDGDQRLDFALEKGAGISGTILLPDGQPAAGAEVAVCTDDQGAALGQRRFLDGFQRTITAADERGEFVLPQIAGAESIIAVHDGGFGETNIEGRHGPFQITLAAWGTIEGIATAGSRLLQGERVGLIRESGQAGVSLDRDEFSTNTGVDGAFVFSNVPPGNVALFRIVSNQFTAPQFLDVNAGQTTGSAFTQYNFEDADSPQPTTLKTGDAAPPFETRTVDGKPLRLADYRGKYVLLDFWATWCGPCIGEMPHLKAVYDAFGGGDRFVMISLSLDNSASAPAEFARKNHIQWTQGFLGPGTASPVTPLYGVDAIPSIFLIDPDGKIIARDLRGDGIAAAVEKAVGKR